MASMVVGLFTLKPGASAELVKPNSALCDLTLHGQFEAGDFDKVRQHLTTGMRLCLSSPGGSFMEGLRIFAHIASERIATVVDAGDACYSACAIAFMGGSDGKYGTRYPSRTLHAAGSLGFHSPFLNADRIDNRDALNFDTLGVGFAAGISVVSQLLRSDQYGLIPRTLLADMLETSPTSLYYVDTFKKARSLSIALSGVKAPVPLTKRMLYQACHNADPWTESFDPAATSEEAANSERPRPKTGRAQTPYRIMFNGFGFKAMDTCVVDVVSAPGKEQQLFIRFDESALSPADLPTPLWYVYDSGERIGSRRE